MDKQYRRIVPLTMHIPTRFIKKHVHQSHFSGLCGFKGYALDPLKAPGVFQKMLTFSQPVDKSISGYQFLFIYINQYALIVGFN